MSGRNPRRNALFGAVRETRGLQGLDGGALSLVRTRLPDTCSLKQGTIQAISRLWAPPKILRDPECPSFRTLSSVRRSRQQPRTGKLVGISVMADLSRGRISEAFCERHYHISPSLESPHSNPEAVVSLARIVLSYGPLSNRFIGTFTRLHLDAAFCENQQFVMHRYLV